MYSKIKNRSEFVILRKSGDKIVTKGVVVEYKKCDPEKCDPERGESKKVEHYKDSFDAKNHRHNNSARLGFTASKKIGSAVYRNKAKRRLKAAINHIENTTPKLLEKNYEINFIARYTTIERPFEKLVKDIIFALNNLK